MPEVSVFGLSDSTGRSGRENIADAIAREMEEANWDVHGTECRLLGCPTHLEAFDAPPVEEWPYDCSEAAVITVGKSDSREFGTFGQDHIRDMLHANLELPLKIANRYVEQRGQKPSTIVFIGSYGHEHPFTNGTLYTAAKAGLNMAAKNLAWDLAPWYNVFVVNPWHVPGTPMWGQVIEDVQKRYGLTEDDANDYAFKDKRQPPMTPEEVARVIARILEEPNLWARLSGQPINLYQAQR